MKNKYCKHCDSWTGRAVTVDAVVFRRIDKTDYILLIKRGNEPEKGKWALPGGYIDWDENAAQGAIRELKEETGLVANSVFFNNVFHFPDRDIKQNIAISFIMTVEGEPVASDDAAEVKWVDIRKLISYKDNRNLAFDHYFIIGEAIDRFMKIRNFMPGMKVDGDSKH